jgi:hypothetical protein
MSENLNIISDLTNFKDTDYYWLSKCHNITRDLVQSNPYKPWCFESLDRNVGYNPYYWMDDILDCYIF